MRVTPAHFFFIGLLFDYNPATDSKPVQTQKVLKCGIRPAQGGVPYLLNLWNRIVGGKESEPGAHPWQVSLKRRKNHYCGGTIISEKWVLTAAHCIRDRNILSVLKVTAGEYNLKNLDKEEQTQTVKRIIIHPKFKAAYPVEYDIALLEINGIFTFGENIYPACLPNEDDTFDTGTICTTAGWGRLSEGGRLPNTLQEVQLPILDFEACLKVMQSVIKRFKGETLMCAGFPDGRKDACQGDSGGPLMCRGDGGAWTVAGVTSWGIGCGRSWKDNKRKSPNKRGTPGIFAKVKALKSWIQQNMNNEIKGHSRSILSEAATCSVSDGTLMAVDGRLDFPESPRLYYENNEICLWTISVPEGKHILLEFTQFDVEPGTFCGNDYLSVYAEQDELIGTFCDRIPPAPLLISINTVTLKFVSDFNNFGTGFSVQYRAVEPGTLRGSGCGSLETLSNQGMIQSMRFPQQYSSNAQCQWLIQAPENHVIKLEFKDFEVELSNDCSNDLLTVHDAWAESNQSVKLCGLSPPTPVFSNGTAMMLQFSSDGTQDSKGFRAAVTFIDASAGGSEAEVQSTVGTSIAGTLSNLNTVPFTESWLLQEAEPYSQGHRSVGAFGENPVATDLFRNSIRKVNFSTGCEDVILMGTEGEIQSPGYIDQTSCLWRIIVPRNRIIKLNFKAFNVNVEREDCADSVAVYDGVTIGRHLKAKLCGLVAPCTIWSSGPALTVEFTSNSTGSSSAIWLVYTTYDSKDQQQLLK
ncbi:ovochymase-2 isoform X3 [Heterodontus francisci]|uniref:ovochymase-2 isoform X3 n=1 Tax=Heterodontus francisci TaxID=7792 RepID=UPI00355B1BF1